METTNDHPLLRQGSRVRLMPPSESGRDGRLSGRLDRRQALGMICVVAAFVIFLVGWWGISGTNEVSLQLPYLLSAGLTGAGLLVVGALFFMAYEHCADRAAIAQLERRLDELAARVTT